MSNIPIYTVSIVRHYCGCRIEAYTNKIFIYTDQAKALNFAFQEAVNFAVQYGFNPPAYDVNGTYSWPDYSYSEWEECGIRVKSNILDFSQDVHFQSEFNA